MGNCCKKRKNNTNKNIEILEEQKPTKKIILDDFEDIKLIGSKVITSIGYIPTPKFKKSKHVHLVGDCNGVGNLRTVIWRAWDVCMKI